VTSGNRIVSERQPEHHHTGNGASANARRAVGEMKKKMEELTVTASTSRAAIVSTFSDDIQCRDATEEA